MDNSACYVVIRLAGTGKRATEHIVATCSDRDDALAERDRLIARNNGYVYAIRPLSGHIIPKRPYNTAIDRK